MFFFLPFLFENKFCTINNIFHFEIIVFPFVFKFLSFCFAAYPMDTSSSILHRLDVKIPRGNFVEITSILKGQSTWKLWHRFDMDISTWIRLSKSKKYRQVLRVDFFMLFRRQIDVTSVLAFSALGTYSKLFWYNADWL